MIFSHLEIVLHRHGHAVADPGRGHVGYMGVGTLNVSDGGMVTSTNGYIGSRPDASGTATVTDGGSRWANSGDLTVGGDGTGTLNIDDQGLVTVGGRDIHRCRRQRELGRWKI